MTPRCCESRWRSRTRASESAGRTARGADAQLVATALATVLLAGCAVGPNYRRPPIELHMPDAWHQGVVRSLVDGSGNLRTWWTSLNDPMLDTLIQRSFEGNYDLKIAVGRVYEARARRGIARGEWFPSIDGFGSYQRARESKEILPIIPPGLDRTDNFLDVGLDSSWELDFFGRIRRSVEAADADLQASVENYRDALVILFADVASNYVNVRTLQARIEYTKENVRRQQTTLRLTVDRNRAGLVPDLDVRQAELNLATTEAFLPQLVQALAEAVHRLGVLAGDYPSSLYGALEQRRPIPRPPDEVLIGVPANLMRQRPDIRSAERQLAAQTARIGVATADLYPRFALLGTFAFSATDVADLFTGDARTFSFGPAFRWNIFDAGRIRNNIRAQDALTEQALSFYEQTVLSAVEDVENAMVAFVQEQDRRDALDRSVVAAQKAVDLVTTLYRIGLTDFQNVQDTERRLFQQQDELAASDGLVTRNLIRIYKAFGGGWDVEAVPPGEEPMKKVAQESSSPSSELKQ
jgi:multidrug efflux system outer membrane protein